MVYWLESMYLPFVDLLFLFFDRGKSLENGLPIDLDSEYEHNKCQICVT